MFSLTRVGVTLKGKEYDQGIVENYSKNKGSRAGS